MTTSRRTVLAMLTASAICAATAAKAQQRRYRDDDDSGRSSRRRKRDRSSADSFTSGRRGDSKDDIDARAADPGGDYASYPSWARKSLGGNRGLW